MVSDSDLGPTGVKEAIVRTLLVVPAAVLAHSTYDKLLQ